MADIRQFINDAVDARDQSGGRGGVADWIAAADKPTAPRETRVAEALKKLPRTPQRALLLCTAMLHGAHADVIDWGTATLLASLSDGSGTTLSDLPLDERLQEIEAKPDAARHVRFVSPGYEAAVRAYFWRHFPELHGTVADWVRMTLDSKGLSDDDRETLARGFTELCVEQRYQPLWRDLVRHLTSRPAKLTKMVAAATILEHGLLDEKNSRTFRRQVYEWSLDDGTSDILAEVLVAACDMMAGTHASEALVRLHHLARRHPRRVGARDALAALARGDHWLMSLLLSRLTRRSPEAGLTTDAEIFLTIADASHFTRRPSTGQPLIRQSQVASQLTAGWALAFTRLPSEQWASQATDWLHCAAEDNANRHVLVDVLVEGAREITAVLPKLYALAHRGAFRDVITGLVLTKISAIQGIELP